MEEAEEERLENYPNLGALFRRALKDGARPVDETAMVVSPADGHVIWFGEVSPDGEMEQVGGSLTFLYEKKNNQIPRQDCPIIAQLFVICIYVVS